MCSFQYLWLWNSCCIKTKWTWQYCHCSTVTHTHLTALCPGLPRWAGTRKVKTNVDFTEAKDSGSGISWAICKSAPRSRQITMPEPHRSVFYRLDALPATQPTASKHWRHATQSNNNKNKHPFNGPFLGLPRWAGTRKVKPIWILLKQDTVSGSGISWVICKSAPRSRQITTPAPHHSVFCSLL